MNKTIVSIENLTKSFGDRLLFHIPSLKIMQNDRIGIVGLNGCGKTTLLKIIAREMAPDEGTVNISGPFALISQFDGEIETEEERPDALARFGVKGQAISGGERTRARIARAMARGSVLLLADEPTSNLDAKGIELLKRQLAAYDGALLMVSHDRELLDACCNTILEIEEGKVVITPGNYSNYQQIKEARREREEFEYDQYRSEKRRLEQAERAVTQAAAGMKKAPSRMGNSEARLHKLGNQKGQKKVQNRVNAIHTRIEQLEEKERPADLPEVRVDLGAGSRPGGKILLEVKDLNIGFGSRKLLRDAAFVLESGSKTLLIGPNGSGKTTLLERLVQGGEGIRWSPATKVGYFKQDLSLLDEGKTLLQNVLEESIRNETQVRTLLSRLYFSRDDLKKPAALLSGGERVKASLCKLIAGDYNLLLLDEPTNYLDLFSLEALEQALQAYGGTLLFVSHDRRFARQVADHLLIIENERITPFAGGIDDFDESRRRGKKDNSREEILLLEMKRSAILSKLSAPTKKDDVVALDSEYQELTARLRQLRG